MYLIAMADGKVADEEEALLAEVAQKMGISEEDQEAVKDNAEILGFFMPNDPKERLVHLEHIVRMMMVDSEIHDKEYQLCLQYADRSGHDQSVFEKVIDKIIQEKKATM
ncbi:hypothetical protein BKI52_05400 [marine bacterium AO1-C]|nr:hypothetical protein BKI52_05400 [marine bacterium AO1-C]